MIHISDLFFLNIGRKLERNENSFISDQEFNQLILEVCCKSFNWLNNVDTEFKAYKGFIIVVECETGNIIHVSDSIENVLKYNSV